MLFRRHLWRGFLLVWMLGTTQFTACAPVPDNAGGPTFILVRHAEKAGNSGPDPALTPAGQERARKLAASLRAAPLAAAYATPYRRTQMTAAPAAREHDLVVTTYDARQPSAFAAMLRREHRGGTVLVVGHANTVPEIAAALCGCAVAPMGEDEYDRRLTVRTEAGDQVTLHEDRY